MRSRWRSTASASADRVVIEGEGRAYGDPLRVRQVVRNLVSNALQYGGREIIVRIDVTGEVASLAVIDDGPGIAADRVARIFDAFERSHDDPGRPGSMGLGLTVAWGLARLMNGTLDYRRMEGMTEFQVTLPKNPTIATTEVRELVYQSRASTDMEPDQLEEILTVARRNNRQAGLTGLLLYHEGDFLQVLEGASDKIDEVFGVIRNDDRHHRVNVVVDRVVPARSFGEWEMGFYEIHDPLDTGGRGFRLSKWGRAAGKGEPLRSDALQVVPRPS